jgi:hypothetical protein
MKKLKQKNLYLKVYFLGLSVSAFFVPFFAFGQARYSQDLFGIFRYLVDIFNDIVVWGLVTAAVLYYIVNLIRYLWKDPGGKDAKKYILYGLIILTLMFTFYAVMGLIAITFGINLGIPQFFGGGNALGPGAGNVSPSYSIIGR